MMLKSYKIDLSMYKGEVRRVVSKAVQKKAFDLGYWWIDTGKAVFEPESLTIIYFTEKGSMHGNAYEGETETMTEISAADFLSLTTAEEKQKRKDGWYWARLSGATAKLIVEYKNGRFEIPDGEGSTCNDAEFAWIAEGPIPEPTENKEGEK